MSDVWLYIYDDPPIIVGWYATTYCWDIEEGIFAGPNYWDGTKWIEDLPVTARSQHIFATKHLAEAWADAHDPDR